jgi:hypothetical protein
MLWAAVLALLLGLRLLSPAGFMPAFEHGAVTIVACPDATAQEATGHHHHHAPKKLHQPCPYAAASALGLPIGDVPISAAFLSIGLALLLGRTFLFVERSRLRERPPLRGPPLPA